MPADKRKPVKKEGGPGEGPAGRIVVGIGSSAGGLKALTAFLEALPPDTGMAFVVIQHLDPTHDSLMAELLGKHTKMQVVEANGPCGIEADHVYMIPPNRYLMIENGRLVPTEPVKEGGLRMPIDFFFRSLADQCGEKAVSIVLTGTGSDGSQGLREVKEAGGLTTPADEVVRLRRPRPTRVA